MSFMAIVVEEVVIGAAVAGQQFKYAQGRS
jgi:hypothetical protein